MKTVFVVLLVFLALGLFVRRFDGKARLLLAGIIVCMLGYLYVS